MARTTANSLLKNISGQVGKQLVFKQYADKTVVTKYPDMSRVEASPGQKNNRSLFKEAVAYAREINADPHLKQQYTKKTRAGESVYHYAFKEYLKKQR